MSTTRSARRRAVLGMVVGLALAAPALGQTVAWTADGAGTGDVFGVSLAGGADASGDGVPDCVAGAPEQHPAFAGKGYARLLSGADGSVLFTWIGDALDDDFGRSVCLPGDLDGDGRADVLVGAPKNDANGTDAGLVRAFSGASGAVLYQVLGAAPGDAFGYSLAAIGDVNADGHSDFMVGAVQSGGGAGYAHVRSGQNGALLRAFNGIAAGDRFGVSVSSAGDIDLDGSIDFAVGAELEDTAGLNAGSARIFSGATGLLLRALLGATEFDEFGHRVDAAGDVNLDGTVDLLVGAWRDDDGGMALTPGSATVWSGANGSQLHRFVGITGDDLMGTSVAGAGDVNGDGWPDVLVAARHDTNDEHTGVVYLYSGRDGAALMTLFGDEVEDSFGLAIARAGDLDGDGLADFAAGATEAGHGAPREGYVRAFLGGRGSIVSYGVACEGSGGFLPKLYLSGSPEAGKRITVEVSRALGGSTALVRFARKRDSVPFQGCTLYLGNLLGSTMLIPLSGSAPGEGTGSKSRQLPITMSPGSRITLQAFISDPAGAQGSSATNAIEFRLP